MSLDPSALLDVHSLVERRGPLEPVFTSTVLWFVVRALELAAGTPDGRLGPRQVSIRAGGKEAFIEGATPRPLSAAEQAMLVRDLGNLTFFMLMAEPPWAANSFDDTASVCATATAAVQAKLLQGPAPAKAAPLIGVMTWALSPTTPQHTLAGLLARLVAVPRLERLPTDLLADVRVGMVVAGRYELLRVVGAGAMASVFAARRLEGGPEVAIKVIEDREGGLQSDQRLRRRLARELRGFARVDHPNVVSPTEAGFDDALEAPYLVMELLSGQDLAAKIERAGPLDWRVAAELFAQAARGLGAAHRAGLIHRDIKPANLFLHQAGGATVLKVCDFGLARTIVELDPAAATRSGVMLGSPAYMSPEQIASARRADARSDVWSLGVSLYETLAGVLPWRVKGVGALLAAVSKGDKRPLSVTAPAVPLPMVELVERMLAVDPAARPASMERVAAELQAMLPAPSLRKRLRKRLRWGLGVGLAVVLLAGGVLGAAQLWSVRTKKRVPNSGNVSSASTEVAPTVMNPQGCVVSALQDYRVRGLSLRTVESRILAAGYTCYTYRVYTPDFSILTYQSTSSQSCFANILFGSPASVGGAVVQGRPHREDEQHSYALVSPPGCPNPLQKEDILKD